MEVRVLLFGPHAQAAGAASVMVTLNGDCTCGALLSRLADEQPLLRPLLSGSRVALNHAFAPSDRVIAPSDAVALIGLVSGG